LFALRICNSLEIDLDRELDLLIELFRRLNYQTNFLQKQIIISMSSFLKNEKILTVLESFLDKNDFLSDKNIINIAYRLAKKNPTHPVAVAKLIYALDSPDQSIKHEARTLLCEVSSHNLEIVSILLGHMQNAKFPETIGIALNILSIDSQNEEALTELTMSLRMLDFVYHDDLIDKAFVETAVPLACYLLKGKVFEFRPMQIVIQYLIKAFDVDSKSTKSLSFSDTQFNTVLFWYCCRTLEHCAQNMSYPDFYRAWHSSSSANSALPISD